MVTTPNFKDFSDGQKQPWSPEVLRMAEQTGATVDRGVFEQRKDEYDLLNNPQQL